LPARAAEISDGVHWLGPHRSVHVRPPLARASCDHSIDHLSRNTTRAGLALHREEYILTRKSDCFTHQTGCTCLLFGGRQPTPNISRKAPPGLASMSHRRGPPILLPILRNRSPRRRRKWRVAHLSRQCSHQVMSHVSGPILNFRSRTSRGRAPFLRCGCNEHGQPGICRLPIDHLLDRSPVHLLVHVSARRHCRSDKSYCDKPLAFGTVMCLVCSAATRASAA
jgi:hypothetical protein